MKQLQEIKRGDIFEVDLGSNIGSVQSGIRPCIAVQNNVGNKFAPTVIFVPLTSKMGKRKLPTHVFIDRKLGLKVDSIALAEQIVTIDKSKVLRKFGEVSDDVMTEIDYAIAISNGIHKPDYTHIDSMLRAIKEINKAIRDFGLSKTVRLGMVAEFKNYCGQFNLDYNKVKNERLAIINNVNLVENRMVM